MKPEKVAKNICNVLNEISDLGSADSTPSFYNVPGIWFEVDSKQKDSFIISDAIGRDDEKKAIFRVTVTKLS